MRFGFIILTLREQAFCQIALICGIFRLQTEGFPETGFGRFQPVLVVLVAQATAESILI